jgi:hypothetical protein
MKPSELKARYLADNLQKSETYAGLILGKNGEPDYHLVLLPGEASDVTRANAKEFAKKAGGELPSRREQSLLFANLKEAFKPNWYWSSEQYASDARSAWVQHFFDGGQFSYHIYDPCRAVAVRRLIIE